jgi:predicted transglutaminase-like protease
MSDEVSMWALGFVVGLIVATIAIGLAIGTWSPTITTGTVSSIQFDGSWLHIFIGDHDIKCNDTHASDINLFKLHTGENITLMSYWNSCRVIKP